MTEREMLELAAKAYGIELEYRQGSDAYYYDNPETGREQWCPHGDNSQALELAGALNLDIEICEESIDVWFCDPCECKVIVHIDEPVSGDKMASIRLAITKAAAELGKLKEQEA